MSARQHLIAVPPLAPAAIAVAVGSALLLAAGIAHSQVPHELDAQSQADGGSRRAGEEELEEVTVLGTHVNVLETIQDVPNSVSIVSGDELAQLDATNLDAIFQRIGNVQWNYGNPKTGSISLRGIPTGGSETQDPSLGINYDNVAFAYAPFATGLDYVDLESVDVSRGPQGFDGGRATTTGAINIRTRRPTFMPEGYATILLGQDNALSVQGAVGGPVVDGLLAWRGTFLRNQREGAFANNYRPLNGRITFGDTNRTYGRLQFLLTPFEGFEALASFDFKPKGSEYVNGTTVRTNEPDPYYADGSSYNDWTQNSARAKLYRPYFTQLGYTYDEYLNNAMSTNNNLGIANGTKGASVNLSWNAGNFLVTSTTAWRQNWFQAANDDNTPLDITADGGLYVHYNQRSQELKLASTPGGAIDYVVGVYLLDTQSDAASRTHQLAEAGVWQATPVQYYGITTPPPGYRYDTVLTPAPGGLGSTAAGLMLAQDALKGLWYQSDTLTDNSTRAAYGKVDLHLYEYIDAPLTLGLGLRFSKEHRRTYTGRVINDEGTGAALNPANAGGFNSNAAGALTGTNTEAQLLLADSVASRYFGVASTGVPGGAYNSLTAAQRQQVGYAKAIRNGQRGTPTALAVVAPFKDTLPTWTASLTYKASDSLSLYGTYQHGAKPGYAQNVTIPSLAQVSDENTDAYEIGVRSASFNRSLIVNASVFYQLLNDYQTTLYKEFTDPQDCGTSTPPCFLSVSGNLPQVTIRGIELDASYSIGNFSIRAAAVLNDIYYSKNVLLAVNAENNIPSLPISQRIFQAKGERLAGTAKYSYNLAADYRAPLRGRFEAHVDANYNWKGKYNDSAQPSLYGVYPANGVLDVGVGISTADRSLDATVLVKNALDSDKRIGNPTITSYVPATPRWVGIQFTGRL